MYNNLTIYEKAKFSLFPGTFLKDHNLSFLEIDFHYPRSLVGGQLIKAIFAILFWIVIISLNHLYKKKEFNFAPFGKTKRSDNVFSNAECRSFI